MIWPKDILATGILFAITKAAPTIAGTEENSVTALVKQVDQKFAEQAACTGQSCYLADFSGASGVRPTKIPVGALSFDYECVQHYSPAAAWIMANPNAPEVDDQNTGIMSILSSMLNGIAHLTTVARTDRGHYVGPCAPNILIFAKGTLENGLLGALGPTLTSNLPPSWATVGVQYDANLPGTYCLGLPGGMVVKDMINEAGLKCPSSNIFLSGFSQGAMAIRNGLAYADPGAKAHVKGVLTFGDPMQGSPISGYRGPISTFCREEDYICSGNFEWSSAHSAYASDNSIMAGRNDLLRWADALRGPGWVGSPGYYGSGGWPGNSAPSPGWTYSGSPGYY